MPIIFQEKLNHHGHRRDAFLTYRNPPIRRFVPLNKRDDATTTESTKDSTTTSSNNDSKTSSNEHKSSTTTAMPSLSSETASKTSSTTSSSSSSSTSKSTSATTKSSSTSTSTSTSSTSLSTTIKSSTSMPGYDKASSTTTSSTSSMTYNVEIPNKNTAIDPYIVKETLPDGLVFIVFGSIVGAIFLTFIVWRLISSFMANKRARMDSEKYEFNKNAMFIGGGLASSQSSLFDYASEKTKYSSASSINLLSKTFPSSESTTSSTSTQGRTYRNALHGRSLSYENMLDQNQLGNTKSINNSGSRGSMFISPVMETMMSGSKLNLPLMHQGLDAPDFEHEAGVDSSTLDVESSSRAPSLIFDGVLNPRNETHRFKEEQNSQKPRTRPPSQYLENLLNLDCESDHSV